MRFTGEIEDDAAYIWGHVICEDLGIDHDVRFCIDTGANCTCLLENDAISIGVDIRQLKGRKKKVGGIGGSADAYPMEDVKLRFKSDDNRIVIAPFPILQVIISRGRLSKRVVAFLKVHLFRKKRKQTVLPSLLGFDVLQRYTISFSDRVVYLDIDETSLRRVPLATPA